jgi:hypothetical protein
MMNLLGVIVSTGAVAPEIVALMMSGLTSTVASKRGTSYGNCPTGSRPGTGPFTPEFHTGEAFS